MPYGPIPEAYLDLKVANLLTTDLKWNMNIIEEILPQMLTEILRLQPSRGGSENSLIWQPLQSSKYSTRSCYYSVRSVNAPQEEFNWINDIWSGSFSPKMKTFLWYVAQNALPLGINLQRRGVSIDANCPRCKQPETAIHTFFPFPFAKKVWDNIPRLETVHIVVGETDFKDVIRRFRKTACLPPTGVTTQILPWICWMIWKARNLLVFKAKDSTAEETANKGLMLAREWIQAQNQINNNHIPYTWQVLCKTDAEWNKEHQTTGLAWTFTGLPCTESLQGSWIQDFVSSPIIGEALAVHPLKPLSGRSSWHHTAHGLLRQLNAHQSY